MDIGKKYKKTYFMPPEVTYDWVKKTEIEKPPIWCSVDLRDGNQALIEPMQLDEKIEYFKMLVDIGFKEIEIGFPAASETEFQFMRALIDRKLIPEDVTVQVLTQAREHIIRKTFEAVEGAPHAVVHLYNSTSVAQRNQVFKKDKDEIKQIAVDGARLLLKMAQNTKGNFTFEYSPESFSGTEVEYATEVCNAVLDVWQPTSYNKAIINIPTTVENAMPHVFASQLEYVDKHLKYRNDVILSLHPHNDRGTGVATAELGVLAGADRIEGTLFGNGERTGNVDLVTMALNLMSHGVDPGLDFTNILEVRKIYEKLTGMKVYERQPYGGDLVFTAFSGSHQDAIAKGMDFHASHPDEPWSVPYLPVDPRDIGRRYESDVIRINSQSGKGGINYILKTNYGINIPEGMRSEVSYLIKDISDKTNKEITPERVYQIFSDNYIHTHTTFHIFDYHFRQSDGIIADVVIVRKDDSKKVTAKGNGRLDAISNAIKAYFHVDFEISNYEEHALTKGSTSKAVAFVSVVSEGKTYWGVGINSDIIKASIEALIVSVNKLDIIGFENIDAETRVSKMLEYIKAHYTDVTVTDVANKFHITNPYVSKYIHEKTGKTFVEHVRNIRMKKAEELVLTTNMKIHKIAEIVGYPYVEHFNRVFKEYFGCTPLQYRAKLNP
ncbi:MAG: 2-isopropylmalate synthase [Lachnospiraceae bacterium]|jgi:2-isopropylmalate synthase|nr:2-isopropylmalate synthase [Lachnospiraceae bacterium]